MASVTIQMSCAKFTLQFKAHVLTVEKLEHVMNWLEDHGVLDEGMTTCFQVAIKEFHKEPSWVKKNALITLKGDDGTRLWFSAGEKEWKINVFAGDFQYQVTHPLKQMELARLHSQQQKLIHTNLENVEGRKKVQFQTHNLTIENLQRIMNELESHGYLDEGMKNCFHVVLWKFPKEPSWVKENALMILKGDGGAEHRFTAGQEEWKINVFAHDYQYHVIHPSPVMYVARSVYQEQQLSTADLERVKDRKHLLFQTHDLITENLERVKNELESHGFLYGSMRTCFQVVTKEFCKEPSWVKKNALITLKGDDRTKLQFAAGGKEWKINVFAGDFQYRVTSPSPELYLARLRSQQQLQINANLEDMEQRERLCNLTIENLQRTMNELESHGYSDEDMRTCFQVVLKEFPKEPSWVKENALMTLKGDGAEFQFAAGKEDWKINVSAGDYQYWVIPPSPEMCVARLCSMQQLLIPRHLKSMQDSLESGKVMASPVRGCFTLAIQDFSKEPLSTKENALDDEENPEFVFSRNGDCSISVTGGNGMEIATSVLLVVMGIPNPS